MHPTKIQTENLQTKPYQLFINGDIFGNQSALTPENKTKQEKKSISNLEVCQLSIFLAFYVLDQNLEIQNRKLTFCQICVSQRS